MLTVASLKHVLLRSFCDIFSTAANRTNISPEDKSARIDSMLSYRVLIYDDLFCCVGFIITTFQTTRHFEFRTTNGQKIGKLGIQVVNQFEKTTE
jgi:hypothetical protein